MVVARVERGERERATGDTDAVGDGAVVMRGEEWQGQSTVFRLYFILYAEKGERNGGGERREWRKGREGWHGGKNEAPLNYNPLRDTAEFAFKIKWA